MSWYDKYADEWYKCPVTKRIDPDQTPAIQLVGRCLSEAGFTVGGRMDINVSVRSITLTLRE